MVDKEELQKTFGKRVKQLREAKNVSQQDLAYACEFEKSNMARLEVGNTNPTLHTMQKIANALGISLKELVDFPIQL